MLLFSCHHLHLSLIHQLHYTNLRYLKCHFGSWFSVFFTIVKPFFSLCCGILSCWSVHSFIWFLGAHGCVCLFMIDWLIAIDEFHKIEWLFMHIFDTFSSDGHKGEHFMVAICVSLGFYYGVLMIFEQPQTSHHCFCCCCQVPDKLLQNSKCK